MSAFTESALIKKLGDLNTSSQSIQTLSLWLIHHRKHHSTIVKIWFKELQKVLPNRKLVFMYLANDVIQNSKKKGPEFSSSFSTLLTKAFKDISQRCEDDKTFTSLTRILKIWDERGVYESDKIKEFVTNLKKSSTNAGNTSNTKMEPPKPPKAKLDDTPKKETPTKRKTEEASTSNGSDKKKPKFQLPTKVTPMKDRVSSLIKNEVVLEVNGTVETHVTLSPHIAIGDPPEPEELIKMFLELEETASSDAATRDQITKLPPEVLDKEALNKLEDKEQAMKLSLKVNDAVQLLKDYNARLAAEMTERNKLTLMLKDFQREQQELMTQAEQRLEEYAAKLLKIKEVQKEVKNHLQNLPDMSLTNLPDVTGGLAPLPSAGDLFNAHH
ncbi:unnamed protein product [Diamesa serratosioi]